MENNICTNTLLGMHGLKVIPLIVTLPQPVLRNTKGYHCIENTLSFERLVIPSGA